MDDKRTTPSKSFRVPNSVVQGITTNSSANLNRLNAFEMIVLFGLISHIDCKNPKRENELTLGEILEIIQIGKSIEITVDRAWENHDGKRKCRRYHSQRISPAYYQRLHNALRSLHAQEIIIYRKAKGGTTIKHVHLLNSFGYFFKQGGSKLDICQLPEGFERFNDGSNERPLWRVRPLEPGCRFLAPSSVYFQLHPLLAEEFTDGDETIHSTLFAQKIFSIFRQYSKNPAVIRLVVLILRQTGVAFNRKLKTLLGNLRFDTSHNTRAITNLREALSDLERQRVIRSFTISEESNFLEIECNRHWYKEDEE